MRKLRLYPTVQVVGQSYKGVEILAVPKQSLTLQEILRRYVRREPLPTYHQGAMFAENLGDLEKMSREDLTVKHERIAKLRKGLGSFEEDPSDNKRYRRKGKVESPSVPAPPLSPVPASPAVPVNTPPPAPSQAGGGT